MFVHDDSARSLENAPLGSCGLAVAYEDNGAALKANENR